MALASDRNSDDVPTVTKLVKDQLDAGVSLREMEERSGGIVPFQQFARISNGFVKAFPKSKEVIEATAKALEVDARQIVLSYATQLGIDVSEQRSPLATMLPASASALSIPQARAIVRLVKTITEGRPNATEPVQEKTEDEAGVTELRPAPPVDLDQAARKGEVAPLPPDAQGQAEAEEGSQAHPDDSEDVDPEGPEGGA